MNTLIFPFNMLFYAYQVLFSEENEDSESSGSGSNGEQQFDKSESLLKDYKKKEVIDLTKASTSYDEYEESQSILNPHKRKHDKPHEPQKVKFMKKDTENKSTQTIVTGNFATNTLGILPGDLVDVQTINDQAVQTIVTGQIMTWSSHQCIFYGDLVSN